MEFFSTETATPPLLRLRWTVEVMDCQDPDISVMDNKLVFTCTGDDMKKYELDIELLQDISSKVVKLNHKK